MNVRLSAMAANFIAPASMHIIIMHSLGCNKQNKSKNHKSILLTYVLRVFNKARALGLSLGF